MTYKAIQVKYLGPTNMRGTRWKATAEGGHSITISRDYKLDGEDDARRVAEALRDRMAWSPITGSGVLPNGDYVFTMGGL
jgi:hypothetical protein